MLLSRLNKILFLAFTLILYSCKFTQMDYFEVKSYSPSEAVLENYSNCLIELEFNNSADKISVEKNFSLSTGGTAQLGNFTWSNDNTKLTYETFEPLDIRKNYEINIKSLAEDNNGNSLREEFSHTFYTSDDITRPYIIEAKSTKDTASLTEYENIVIQFSEYIPEDSYLNSFSISPEIKGVHKWNESNTIFTFVPHEKYEWNQDYTVKIANTLTDYYYNPIAEERKITVSRSSNESALTILDLSTQSGITALIPDDYMDSEIIYNQLIEKDDIFELTFDREVDLSNITTYISFTPQLGYEVQNIKDVYSNKVIIKPNKNLLFDDIYTINIKKELPDRFNIKMDKDVKYYLRVNGTNSTPPKFVASDISFYNKISDSIYYLNSFGNFRDEGLVAASEYYTFIDLHLIASNITILNSNKSQVINSLLDNIRFDVTNSCSLIEVLGAYIDPPTGDRSISQYPDRIHPIIGLTDPNSTVIRVYIKYTPRSASGTITLYINKNFSDGNNELDESLQFTYNRTL